MPPMMTGHRHMGFPQTRRSFCMPFWKMKGRVRRNQSVRNGPVRSRPSIQLSEIFEKLDYVHLNALQADKRNKEIVLTQTGRTYAEKIIEELHQREMHVINTMGEEKIAQLNSLMAQFSNCFEEQEDDHA